MNNNISFDEMLKRMSGSLNTTPQSLEEAAKNGTLGDILKGVDKKKLDKLQKVLNNREETEKIIELEGDQKTISDTLDTIKQLMAWKTADAEEIGYGH